MNYNFVKMNKNYAKEIHTWEYDDEYSRYSYTNSECLMDPNSWGTMFAVLDDDNNLVAEVTFYSNDNSNETENLFEEADIFYGQGMRPDLTGKGYGSSLVKESIKFAIDKFDYKREYIYLDVLSFNKRAYKAYEKAGFEFFKEHSEEYDGEKYEFIRMRYKNPKFEI